MYHFGGDFNSRTGLLNEIKMHVLLNGQISNLVVELNNAVSHISAMNQIWYLEQRKCQDKTVNSYGKDLIDLCRASNLRIMNGFYNAHETDKFTCHTPMGQSIVDYLLCSENMFSILTKL